LCFDSSSGEAGSTTSDQKATQAELDGVPRTTYANAVDGTTTIAVATKTTAIGDAIWNQETTLETNLKSSSSTFSNNTAPNPSSNTNVSATGPMPELTTTASTSTSTTTTTTVDIHYDVVCLIINIHLDENFIYF
jgi:uncharacterized protein involved in outer membrane biogenesis